uniref:glucuronosyltransferase n=1 Tax=Panagrellus redivivus TaxID=6233 RepID=A0A7E4VFM2_PANRE
MSSHDLYIFSHPLSTSHLPTMFTLAKRSQLSGKVYDVRWPLLDGTKTCKAPEIFVKTHFTSAFYRFKRLKTNVDNTVKNRQGSLFVFIDMLNQLISILLSPCSFAISEKVPKSTESQPIALIDPYGFGCTVAHARAIDAKIAYVAPMIESSSIQALSASPLTSYASSMIQGGIEPNLRNRLGNAIGHIVFRLFFVQLPLAKWYYPQSRGLKHFSLPTESMVFVNGHKFVDQVLPRTNLIVDIGGFHVEHEERSTEDAKNQIASFMAQYDDIVFISLGTFTADGQFPKLWKKMFIKAILKYPKVGFIWKFKPDSVEKPPRNLLLLDGFIPQNSLLESPKMTGFITNLGQNSFLEALRNGVPVIGIPILGDQSVTSEKVTRLGIGIVFSLPEATDEILTNAIRKCLDKKSKIVKRSQLIRDMLIHERETGIATDGSHALSRLAKLKQTDFDKFYLPKSSIPFYAYWMLDWALLTFVLATIFALF